MYYNNTNTLIKQREQFSYTNSGVLFLSLAISEELIIRNKVIN